MKRIFSVLVFFAFLAGLTTNCNDDNGGGGIIPPPDTTLWDFILEYPVDITMSAVSYDGAQVELDFATIAQHLGISKDDLLLSMADSISDPDVTLYGIGKAATEDVVVGAASNTNGIWGHWWDANGVNCSWGETAAVFAEYWPGDEFITIGQYPGHLTEGQVVEFYECIKLGEVRVACHFVITAKAPEVIEATIVNTQQLSLEVLEKTTYDMDSVAFNLDLTLSDLGVSSMDEVTLIAVNADGSFAQEMSAEKGYWIDRNGFASGWGAGGVVYTDYGSLSANMVGVGQFPDSLSAGEEFTIKFGFLANDKIEMLAITITVVGYIDPETAPEGDPEDLTLDVAMNQAFNTAYTSVSFDVKETLRNAFKMTTYQIHKAIVDGNLLLYEGEVADTVPGYTADAPGFWLNSEGKVTTWGTDSKIWCSLGHTETELYLWGGNHPELASSGDIIITKFIAICNGGSATFNITYTID